MTSTQVLSDFASALASGAIEVVDLSAPLGPDTPLIKLPPEIGKNTPAIEVHAISHYDKDGPFWAWNWLKLGEHSGTHFDAPVHWISGRDYKDGFTDTIPVKNFVAPACVIDCSAETAKNPDFLLTVDGVKAWEKTHGDIPAGCWVLMRTDWSKRKDATAFLNITEDGAHVPGPHPELVPFLAKHRDVIGWGSEAVGTDAGQAFRFNPPFPCHSIMHGSGKFGLASLANLDRLPPKGAMLVTPPLKIVNGSGSPCRVLALVSAGR